MMGWLTNDKPEEVVEETEETEETEDTEEVEEMNIPYDVRLKDEASQQKNEDENVASMAIRFMKELKEKFPTAQLVEIRRIDTYDTDDLFVWIPDSRMFMSLLEKKRSLDSIYVTTFDEGSDNVIFIFVTPEGERGYMLTIYE